MATTRVESRTGPVGAGLVGAGMISKAYLENLTTFPDVRVVVVGDLDPARARARAEEFGVASWGTAEDVLAHPDVELVVNLTIPAAHVPVSSAAVAAGRHVWSEKPIGVEPGSARQLLDDARTAGRLVGVAPDTLLGPGFQTARRVVERGDIGVPLSAQTMFQWPGPDLFHPDPEFLFAAGAGPLFDIGPYYLSALAHLFGPFASVAAVGSTSRPTRTIQVGERAGTEFPVVAPTHVAAIARFAGGAVSQSVLSFDSPLARMGFFEVTGTEGTLLVPDPNRFFGPVRITRPVTMANRAEPTHWEDVDVPQESYGRGAGALDLARCIRTGGTPVASGELALHILEVMAAIEESIRSGRMVEITSAAPPVPLLPADWDPHAATL